MFLQKPSNPNKQTTIITKSFKQPIHNELNDDPEYVKNKPSYYLNDDLDSIPLPSSELRTGTEIAPPPTYEYYGPNKYIPKVQNNFISVDEMQDSISKGFINENRNKTRLIKGFEDDDK